MSLKDNIERAMLKESMDDKIQEISELTGIPADEVEAQVDNLSFKAYIAVMTALKDKDSDTLNTLLNVNEATTQGTVSVTDKQQQQTPYQRARGQVQDAGAQQANDPMKRTQALQRLGKKNLGGVTANQAAAALDRAEKGQALTGPQRKAMAAQAQNLDALASDPKTASQFRQLLNKLNKQ